MEKQQPQLPKDFFKQFKNKEEFNSFFNNLFKQEVEEMLKGELDEHLGYKKHTPEGATRVTAATGPTTKRSKPIPWAI